MSQVQYVAEDTVEDVGRGFRLGPYISIHGTEGTLVFEGSGYTLYDAKNKEVKKENGPGGHDPHLQNFLDAIWGKAKLNSEIEEGHKSTLLCHLGNIAYRQVRIAEIEVMATDRDLWPQLDFVGSWGTVGVRRHSYDSWGDVADLDFPDWSVRLEFSIPIGNNAARGRHSRALLVFGEVRRAFFEQEHASARDRLPFVRRALGSRSLSFLFACLQSSQ